MGQVSRAEAERLDRRLAFFAEANATLASSLDYRQTLEAIARVASEIQRIQSQYGPDAVGVLSGASLTTEKAYLMGKFARVCLKTKYIDYNGRLCMVSAGAANKKAFGIDRSASPWDDILNAEVVLVAGSNTAECSPITTNYVWQAREHGAKVIVVDRPGAVQSEIRIGHIGVPRNTPDYFPITVMNTILGGAFSSRLNLNLREKEGFTYGVRSSFVMRRAPGPFVVSTAVQSEVTGPAVGAILSELRARAQ